MRARINPWIHGVLSAFVSGGAKAAQTADAAHLSGGSADSIQHSHPILAGFIHIVFILVVVVMAASVYRLLMNPRSSR